MVPRISYARSGGLDLPPSRQRWTIAAVMLGSAALSALAACALRRAPVAITAPPACRAGAPECPIDVAFTNGSTVVTGKLSPEHGNVSYAFITMAPARLQWTVFGPAVRIVLTRPDGNADGPGLSAVVPLPAPGRYVFSLASNTMAEGIYGSFRLELRLLPYN